MIRVNGKFKIKDEVTNPIKQSSYLFKYPVSGIRYLVSGIRYLASIPSVG
jgi:hypothetical protein